MVQQECGSQHAALGDIRQGVNVVHAKCLKGGGKKCGKAVGWVEFKHEEFP